jgi:ATP-dependent Lhr-like helicase
LSSAVSRLREQVAHELETGSEAALRWLIEDVGLTPEVAQQIVDYLSIAKIALGVMPDPGAHRDGALFDESGGTQLVIHSPYGSRINKAWGLALRKRFCRKFNFEIQAAATEDSIILSLSTSHSFPLDEVPRYLNSKSVREVLIQAMLDAPMFGARWRWAGDDRARPAALPRRQESAAADPADGRRGLAGDGISGSGRVRREPGRRADHP